jgi:hypothetical protein
MKIFGAENVIQGPAKKPVLCVERIIESAADFTYNGEANINLEYGASVYTKEISFNSSSGWQQFEIEFPMVTRYAFTVEVAIHFCVPVNGNWWIDDVTLAAN